MASFPDVDLEVTVEAAFGADVTASPLTWPWTDLSSRKLSSPIRIQRGTAFGASTRSSLSARGLELDNDDGWLTPKLASSPYHPYVDVGTPFRIRVRTTTDVLLRDSFTRTTSGTLGTNDSGYTYQYFGSGSTAASSVNGSIGQFATPAVNVIYRILNSASYTVRDVDLSFDVSVPATASGSSITAGSLFRAVDSTNYYWASVEFGTAGVIFLNIWKSVAGVFTLVTSFTTGLSYSAGQMIRTRVEMIGDRIRAKVWPALSAEPALWGFEVYDTAFTAAGRIGWSFWLPAGNANTLPFTISFDNLQVVQPKYERVEGYISDVRPVFIPVGDGTVYSKVQIDIGGVDVILERKDAAEVSPLRRSIEKTPNITPVAYWPLEDKRNSTFAASAFPDGPKLIPSGPVIFAAEDPPPYEVGLKKYGTDALASVAPGVRLAGAIPNSGVDTEWAASIMASFYKPDVTGTEMRIMQWTCPGGSLNRWAIVATNTSYLVRAYNDGAPTSTNVATYTPSGGVFDDLATFTVEAVQNGANVDVQLFVDDFFVAGGSVAGTISAPAYVAINPDQTNTTGSTTIFGLRFLVGHCRFVPETTQPDSPYYTIPETGFTTTAQRAWWKEPDHRRLKRLIGDEEKVPFRFLGDPGTTGYTLLGGQPNGNFRGLVERTVESSSGGILVEEGFGYLLVPRTYRYNRAADLVINMATYGYAEDTDAAEDILVPKLDGRAPNSITVARTDGVESTYAASTAYRKQYGTIGQRYELDLSSDDQPREHAAWRVHVNTDAQDVLYPDLTVDLAANPGLIDSYVLMRPGARVQRTNQPTKAGIGTIDQIAEGMSELIGQRTWVATLNASPAEVYDVGVWDDPNTIWALSATTLQAGISSSALSMSVNGEILATGAVSWLMSIDGEQMTVTNVSGSGPYTLTIGARSVNGKVASHLAGAAVTFAKPDRYAL